MYDVQINLGICRIATTHSVSYMLVNIMQEEMVWKLLFILHFYFLKFPKLVVGSLN